MHTDSEREYSGRLLFLTVLLLFFLSGASGLVYQIIWVRLLTRVFGTTTFAVSSLLAAFMAGLGLGAYLAGRYLVKRPSPLRWFGLLEIGVGVYALSLNALLPWAERMFVGLISGSELSLYQESLLKILLSFAVLLPPTTLMGASLPLLAQHSVDRMGSLGMKTGSLYALNTFGAAVGCFLAGFYFIAHWGLATTTALAAATNAFVGTAAIVLSYVSVRWRSKPSDTSSESPRQIFSYRSAVFAFAVSGFVAIGLEVVWTRLFTLVFKGYTYSFSSMLTMLLVGIATGSITFAGVADRSRDPQRLLGKIQMSAAIAVLALSPIFLISEDLLSIFSYHLGYEWLGRTLAKSQITFLILFLPTFLFGAQFPAVSRLATESVDAVGGRVGNLYAANVVGSIAGALVTGFVLIPSMGTHLSLWLLCGSLLVSGVLLLSVNPAGITGRRRWIPVVGVMAAGFIMVLSPTDLSRTIHEGWLGNKESMSFYKEGTTATVMVGDSSPELSEHERILVNGSSASNSTHYGLAVNRIQGCLPFLFDQMPRKVLAICFGTGITFGTLSQFDVEHIDGVDISPEVIEAAAEFAEENYDVVDNEKVTIHIDDGRNFLLKSQQSYDVITMEPMPPALAGVVDMYTHEFYELCLDHLSPGGIMSQWVPLYFLGYDDIRMLYRTFAEAFPYTMVFFHNFDTFLVGSNQPLVISPDAYRERLQSEKLLQDLALIGLADTDRMAGRFLMDRDAMLELGGTAPLVTDDLPYVEFTAPKSADLSFTAQNYLNVTQYATSALPYLSESSSEQTSDTLQEIYERNLFRWQMARAARKREQSRGATPPIRGVDTSH